jgi:hypothetical protein
MSCHLRDIGGYRSTVGYICYRGTEPRDKGKSRPDGKLIEKQQDMEVLGVDLSPSVSIKDRTVVGTSDKIEHMPLT